MKTSISILVVAVLIMTCNFSGFAQENKKASKARKDVVEAQRELTLAEQDSVADFEQFKKESLAAIAENQTKIAALKVKKAKDNQVASEKYNKDVLALEEKNAALKKRIDEADGTEMGMWPSFKRQFTSDMNDIGRAFREMGDDL